MAHLEGILKNSDGSASVGGSDWRWNGCKEKAVLEAKLDAALRREALQQVA